MVGSGLGSEKRGGDGVGGKAEEGLKLSSPSAGEPIIYDWPLTKTDTYDAAGEIIESIRFVSEEHRELAVVMEKVVMISKTDTRSYEAMKHLCEQFSKAAETIRRLWGAQTRADNPSQAYASARLLKHVVQQCYNRSVLEPKRLNHYYDAFSPETYGETSFSMLAQILERLKPEKKDVFVDLGSGVGQVVLYVAGGTPCRKVIGIEKADLPASYAQTMQSEFQRWMRWYGKKYQQFQLIKGDFLDKDFTELITKEATIIFVNNYAFGPDLDHKLKEKFRELKDGTRIISSRPFCKESGRLSERTMGDLKAMLDVEEITAPGTSVSWTCKSIPYYIHTVNHSRIEVYYFSERKGGGGGEASTTSQSTRAQRSSKSSSKSSSRESSRSRDIPKAKARSEASPAPKDAKEREKEKESSTGSGVVGGGGSVWGPTTRRQWNEWVAQTNTSVPASAPAAPAKEAKKRKASTAKEEQTPPARDLSSDSSIDLTERPKKLKRKASKDKDSATPKRPGRPRKGAETPKSPPRKSPASSTEALDLIHSETVKAVSTPRASAPGTVEVAELILKPVVEPLSWIPLSGAEEEEEEGASLPAPVTAALDVHMASLRRSYLRSLERMAQPDFRSKLLEEMGAEKLRGESLRERRSLLAKQVASLQTEGVRRLQARIAQLNLPSPTHTPAMLLDQAKEIVQTHAALKAHHAGLQAQVLQLESRQRALLAGLAGQSEPAALLAHLGLAQALPPPPPPLPPTIPAAATLTHPGLPPQPHSLPLPPIGMPHPSGLGSVTEPAGLVSAKEAVLAQISHHFSRRKSLVSELSRVQAEVLGIQAHLPPQVLQLVDSILPPPPVPVPTPAPSMAAAPLPPTTAAAVASSNAQPPANQTQAKPKKPRASRAQGPRKKANTATAAAAASALPVPANPSLVSAFSHDVTGQSSTDDIDRKVKEIVEKALSVDSKAKSAEKERRQAKGGERKSRAKAGAGTKKAAAAAAPVPVPPNHLPQAAHLPEIPPSAQPASAAAPTFSSPGLVPVPLPFLPPPLNAVSMAAAVTAAAAAAAPSKPVQRTVSGSSAETESLPSPVPGTGSVPLPLPVPLQASPAQSHLSRPSSQPLPPNKARGSSKRPSSLTPQPKH